jgi:hypothetical protein
MAGALAALPTLALAQQTRAQQNNDDEPGDVAAAIRFQKAEDAAAARQARIEEANARQENSADRAVTRTKAKPKAVKTAAAKKTPPPA